MPASSQASFAALEYKDSKEASTFLVSALSPEGGCVWAWDHEPIAPFGFEHCVVEAYGGVPAAAGAHAVNFPFPGLIDYAYKTRFATALPAIVGCYKDAEGKIKVASGADSVHWIQAVGVGHITDVDLVTGRMSSRLLGVDREYTFMKQNVNKTSDKLFGEAAGYFTLADGSDDVAKLQEFARAARTVYHEVGLCNSDFSGQALKISAAYGGGAGLQVNYAALSTLVKKPESAIALAGSAEALRIFVRPAGASDADIEAGVVQLKELGEGDIKSKMEVTAVIVTQEERDELMAHPYNQAITQVQSVTRKVIGATLGAGAELPVDINFTAGHLIRRYLFAVRPEASVKANEPFTWWAKRANADGAGAILEPIKRFGIVYGSGTPYLSERPGIWGREVQHGDHATRIPRGRYIYAVAHCVDATDPNFNGGPDHTKIGEAHLNLVLNADVFAGSPTVDVLLKLEFPQVLRYRGGGVSVKFLRY